MLLSAPESSYESAICIGINLFVFPQQSAPPLVVAGTPAMTQIATTTKIINAHVVEMAKMGLDADVVSHSWS